MAAQGRNSEPLKKRTKDFHEPVEPHFFKVLIPETIQRRELQIPKTFVRRYGKSLADSVLLKVPSGDTWPVKLAKFEDSIIFQDGWQEFMQYYSIDSGNFVVFRYKGKSVFTVMVFDVSTMEIEYPVKFIRVDSLNSEDDASPVMKMKEAGDDLSVKTIDVCDFPSKSVPVNLNSKVSSDEGQDPRCESSLLKMVDESGDDVSVEILGDCPKHFCAGRSESSSRHAKFQWRPLRRSKRINPHCSLEESGAASKAGASEQAKPQPSKRSDLRARDIALKAASEFKSERPFFRLPIRPSYLKNIRVTLPSKFIEENNMKVSPLNVKVQYLDRRWGMEVYYQPSERRSWFSAGWNVFSRDAHLREGDICVFELAKRKGRNVLFNVSIFRCAS